MFFLQKKAAAPAPAAAAAAAAPAAKAAAPAAAAPAANGKAAAAPAAANGKAAAAAPAGPPKDPNDPKVKAEEVHDVYVCVAIVSSLSLSHSLYIVCPIYVLQLSIRTVNRLSFSLLLFLFAG